MWKPRAARISSRLFLAALALCAGVAHGADPRKVIRLAMPAVENKLDPASDSDEASVSILQAIFDSLIAYDYLARPPKLVPNVAELPEVSADGLTYTFRIRKGIYFQSDPAFGGKPRELTAHDFVFSVRRLFDPKVKAQWLFLVDGKLKGGPEGVQALDRYTIRFQLVAPDYSFPYVMAFPPTSAMAREVVEKYGDDIAFHPVGTGPYRVKEMVRGSRIVLEANPTYRHEVFEGDPGPDEQSRAIHARLVGKTLPIAGRVEIHIVDEAQPRWLSFLNGDSDYIRPVPEEFAHLAVPGGRIAPHLAKKGYTATPNEVAHLTYTTLNTAETIDGKTNALGGFSPERIALRRAITMGMRMDEQLAILDKHQGMRAHTVMPPSVSGHDPAFVSPTNEHNPGKAKALLDMFGFVDRDGDGYRENPDGSPLSFDHASAPTLRERQRNELWKKSMDEIGVRVTFNTVEKGPELRKRALLGRIQSFSYGYIADFPDGENMLQLLYKGSIGQVNYAMFDHPEYNALYERMRRMPDSPERNALMERMVKIVLVYAPWVLETFRMQQILVAPWLVGYRKHPFAYEPWKYLDVDLERLARR